MSGSKAITAADVPRVLVVGRDFLPPGPDWEVRTCPREDATLDHVTPGDVDLIILEGGTGALDTVALCERLRASSSVPIAVAVPLDDPSLRTRLRGAGADELLDLAAPAEEWMACVRNARRRSVQLRRAAEERQAAMDELQRMREGLLRIDRCTIIGVLAANVGHELNNVVASLKPAAEFVGLSAQDQRPAEIEDLETIERGVQRLEAHARNLLQLGAPETSWDAPGPTTDLREVVTSTATTLRMAGRSKYVDVETRFADETLEVAMGRHHLEQVWLHLLTNASDAFAGVARARKHVLIGAERRGPHVVCTIEDNGGGIPDDQQARLFEPFFTTKAPGKGTGLGLFVVRHLVEQAGGAIAISTRVGEGTRVTLTFPTPDSVKRPERRASRA